jgi:microcystin-dependent protein
MSFMGGGTTTAGTNPNDPSGWIICDGATRTVTDGRFADLAPILNTYLGVGTNTANSVTPPNLTDNFLRGPTLASANTRGTGGAATVTLVRNNIPTLPIAISDPGHSHFSFVSLGTGGTSKMILFNNNRLYQDLVMSDVSTTGISASCVNATPTTVATLPPFVTMNYIMKY